MLTLQPQTTRIMSINNLNNIIFSTTFAPINFLARQGKICMVQQT